jgi:putative tryptophan/tyrosine transport system substrate-binding protein
MLFYSKRLGLGVTLIALASGILLATDQKRPAADGRRVWQVALVQHASTPLLDDGTQGVLDALAAAGFRDGDNLRLTRFNPEGDMGTANTMASAVVSGPYDLVITVSTLSLQTVAHANKDRQLRHVFGVVADPFSAGVELERDHPERHPPYLVGQGVFLPVEESFRLARQMHPGLRNIGIVWNPSESNSGAFVLKARTACAAMGITLLEANADNAAGVLEAAQSTISRGAQAIWVGGDVTVSVAIDSLVAAGRKAGIPVFTITPGKPDRGTLFDIGINFYECGKLTGALAAEVLNGADPATIPIRDVLDLVPRRLVVNKQALGELKESWRLPDDLVRRADIVVDEKGVITPTKR